MVGEEAPQSAARRAQQSILRDLPALPSGVEELRFPIPRGKSHSCCLIDSAGAGLVRQNNDLTASHSVMINVVLLQKRSVIGDGLPPQEQSQNLLLVLELFVQNRDRKHELVGAKVISIGSYFSIIAIKTGFQRQHPGVRVAFPPGSPSSRYDGKACQLQPEPASSPVTGTPLSRDDQSDRVWRSYMSLFERYSNPLVSKSNFRDPMV